MDAKNARVAIARMVDRLRKAVAYSEQYRNYAGDINWGHLIPLSDADGLLCQAKAIHALWHQAYKESLQQLQAAGHRIPEHWHWVDLRTPQIAFSVFPVTNEGDCLASCWVLGAGENVTGEEMNPWDELLYAGDIVEDIPDGLEPEEPEELGDAFNDAIVAGWRELLGELACEERRLFELEEFETGTDQTDPPKKIRPSKKTREAIDLILDGQGRDLDPKSLKVGVTTRLGVSSTNYDAILSRLRRGGYDLSQ